MPEPDYQRENVKLYLADCLDVLGELETGSVDVVVTDPPYGIGADRGQEKRGGIQGGAALAPSTAYGHTDWDKERPTQVTIDELLRVSRNQIVFGGNYFADMLPPSAGWLVWDKDNGTNNYADFELLWTSYQRAARKVRWRWHGMLQERGERDVRVHPTQKPVGLLMWILENYIKRHCVVCDPFMGSGTTCVACARLGYPFIGVEVNAQYFDHAVKRTDAELSQGKLFSVQVV